MSHVYHFDNKYFDDPKRCGGVNVYQLGEMICEPTTVIGDHLQKWYELTYVFEGKGKVGTNGTETPVSAGDCFVSLPGDVHNITSDHDEPLRYGFVAFIFDKDGGPFDELTARLETCFGGSDSRCVRLPGEGDSFISMFSEVSGNDSLSEIMIGVRLKRLVVKAIRIFESVSETKYIPNKKSDEVLVYRVKEFIRENVGRIERLSDISKTFNYSFHHISRSFSDVCGITLSSYYSQYRMEHAKTLIENGWSITKVSDMLGYSSIHVFTRSFSRFFGQTPSEYRDFLRAGSGKTAKNDG
ncbi:MAG: helix-turn-helix domain-containing protein [Clostridia bacterium]|nr:helix-turn-helix domain-containing protein [Clostridia bacterium]MBR5767629.1 helix-turn-helix domain-containing protein [Clostridia bacterium]